MLRVTGLAARSIGRGLRELAEEPQLAPSWLRRAGGGRKSRVSRDRGLLADLLALVAPRERGDPDAAAALAVQEPAPAGA